jgi:hypothetical protein
MEQSIDPRTVLSPRGSVRNLNVLFDGGIWDDAKPSWSGWSLAKLTWDGGPAVGVRWNGVLGEGVGNPQSRGLPTWFILPEPLAEIALAHVEKHLRGGDAAEDAAEVVSPRRRLLDLISFVRAASDEELAQMIDQMALKPARAA